MTDVELVAAAKERCLKRRMYDMANQCTAAEYYLKKSGSLPDDYRKLMWKLLKMKPAGRVDWMPIGQAKYYSAEDKAYWDKKEKEEKERG